MFYPIITQDFANDNKMSGKISAHSDLKIVCVLFGLFVLVFRIHARVTAETVLFRAHIRALVKFFRMHYLQSFVDFVEHLPPQFFVLLTFLTSFVCVFLAFLTLLLFVFFINSPF